MKPPRRYSLVRRIMLLVLGVNLGSLLLHGVLLVLLTRPMADAMMTRLTAQVSMARQMLASAAPEQRAAVVIALHQVGIRASSVMPDELKARAASQRRPPPPLPELASNAGPGLRLVHASAPPDLPFLCFETRIGEQTWWFVAHLPPINTDSPLMPWASMIVLVGLTAALAMVAGVRMITRPMSELSLQLLSRREQLTPIAPAPDASIEMERVVASFNQLVAAVHQSENVRRDMLAGLSHDLRTPLARLQLRIDCECDEAVAGRLAPDFRAVSHILSQFLAFAQGGKVSPGAPVPAGPVAQQVVDQFSATGHDVALVAGADLMQALPELALHRILSNLIDNALEHGRAPVRVSLEARTRSIRILVGDAGDGIPAHLFLHAQEPFAKLSGDQTNIGHCGLGLAIVSQIAGQLGGSLFQANSGAMASIGVDLPRQAG